MSAVFNTITGEDWKRSLVSARKRRAGTSDRIKSQMTISTAEPVRRPGPGWKWLGCSTWEHSPSGLRISCLGSARLPDGTFVAPESIDDVILQCRCIREQGGNTKRGLMVWALRILTSAQLRIE